jgi:NAD(P)-dependent dehydrogenase (short-subunit alcohol dehydrogenase family)
MSGKTLVLVTGGNQGLGYYAIQQLSATNSYHILMGSRDLSKAEKAIETLADDASANAKPENVDPIQIDMESDESIEKAARTVEEKHGRLDILMINAGVSHTSGTKREQYQRIYDTNLFGAVITIDAFLPLLRKSTAPGGKRIALTSSSLASLKWAAEMDENHSAVNFPIYRSSKTAMNMIMLHYARLLEGEGFSVGANNPGYCATNLNAYNGLKDPREGAKVLVRCATGDKKSVHGIFMHEEENEILPW